MLKKTAWWLALLLAAASLLAAVAPLFFGVAHTGVLALGAFGLLLSFCLFLFRQGRAPRLRRVLALGLAVAFFGGVALSIPMAAQGFFSQPTEAPQTIVVLGAKVNADGSPSLILSHRLATAAQLLDQYPEAVCVVSGGQGEDEPLPEATVMARVLVEQGIGPQRILLEDKSTNTEENMANTAALLQQNGLPAQVTLVTDSFHQYRSSLRACQAGLEPSSVSSVTPWGLFPSYWVREFFALCAYFASSIL